MYFYNKNVCCAVQFVGANGFASTAHAFILKFYSFLWFLKVLKAGVTVVLVVELLVPLARMVILDLRD